MRNRIQRLLIVFVWTCVQYSRTSFPAVCNVPILGFTSLAYQAFGMEAQYLQTRSEEDTRSAVDESTHPTIKLMHSENPSKETIHEMFEPYRRISPPWTVSERITTILMTIFILPFRVFYLMLVIIPIIILARLALFGRAPAHTSNIRSCEDDPIINYNEDPLFKPLSSWRRLLMRIAFPLARSILFFSFGVLYIQRDKVPFSAHVAHRQPKHEDKKRAYVIVANHLGYLDILVLLATYHGSFVAKEDCESTPIIGLCARALQCLFVRSGKPLTSQLTHRIRSTHECHQHRTEVGPGYCPGCPSCMSNLVVFAEGTTTNGTSMIPFRSGVFAAGMPVQPVCVRFPYKHFNPTWETIPLREHVFRTMTQFRNRVHCTELPVYIPSEEECQDARLYAANVQAEFAEVLQQKIIPLNRKHKLLYHSYLLGRESSESDVVSKALNIFKQDSQLQYYMQRNVQSKV